MKKKIVVRRAARIVAAQDLPTPPPALTAKKPSTMFCERNARFRKVTGIHLPDSKFGVGFGWGR